MSDTMITLLVAIFGSNGLFSVILFLANRYYAKKEQKHEDFEVIQKAVSALAHDSYFRHCHLLMAKDIITQEELENHNFLYEAYHSLGMNNTGDRMHELILEKPVKA